MKALRWVLFGILLALFALFAFNNWTYAPVTLPSGTIVSLPLPIIVVVAFLIGWLPMLLLHMAARSSWKRRALKAERLLDETLAPRASPTATAFVPIMPDRSTPPARDPFSPPVRESLSPPARESLSPPARESLSPPAQGQPTVVPPAGA